MMVHAVYVLTACLSAILLQVSALDSCNNDVISAIRGANGRVGNAVKEYSRLGKVDLCVLSEGDAARFTSASAQFSNKGPDTIFTLSLSYTDESVADLTREYVIKETGNGEAIQTESANPTSSLNLHFVDVAPERYVAYYGCSDNVDMINNIPFVACAFPSGEYSQEDVAECQATLDAAVGSTITTKTIC